jgi:hypothetical protein
MKRIFIFALAFFSLAMQVPPTPGRVDVIWARSATRNVNHYNVYYRKTNAGGVGKVKHLANRVGCTLDLESGVSYTVYATALVGTLESGPSNVVTFIAP